MIGAVVLAAGQSRRMGRPKLPLPWGDTTVIGQVVKVLLSAKVDEVVVVVGGAQDDVRFALRGFPVRIVFNPDYANSEMADSLKIGLSALSTGIDATLIVLGDQPQIDPAVVQKLMAVFAQEANPIIVPSYRMRRGHPWLLARELWQSVLDLSPPQTLRNFLSDQAAQVRYLEVDTPSILQDLDSPEDYERLHP